MNIQQQWIDWAQATQRKYFVPASVTIAQFGLESSWGVHMPIGSNNPFGIKAIAGQPSVAAQTHEQIDGRLVTINANFRKFDSLADAFDAHGRLLGTNPLYEPAIQAWLSGNLTLGVRLMAQHYATDPHYADAVMNVINSEGLAQYDRLPPNAASVQAAAQTTAVPQAPAPNPYRPPMTPAKPAPVAPAPKPFWLELLEGLLSLFAVTPRGK